MLFRIFWAINIFGDFLYPLFKAGFRVTLVVFLIWCGTWPALITWKSFVFIWDGLCKL